MAESVSEAQIQAFLQLGMDKGKMVRALEEMNPRAIASIIEHLWSTGFAALPAAGRLAKARRDPHSLYLPPTP